MSGGGTCPAHAVRHSLSLGDGYGIPLMPRDPTVALGSALTSVWRHVSATLGLPGAVPTA